MQQLLEKLSKITNGFKPMETEALQIFKSKPVEEVITLARELLKDERYQVRALAVFLLGYAASQEPKALNILRNEVSKDPSWQVQEILAKAFDQYCKDCGYEKSLPTIEDWLMDENPNLIRAVTEGLRVWTNRPFFNQNPLLAIELISKHKSHHSEYVRKSVGNALKDISRKHKELIISELKSWDLSNPLIQLTYKYATKHLKRNNNL